MAATVTCSWCDNDKVPAEEARKVTFFGRDFILCDQDFRLIWQGFGGLAELARQLKTAGSISRAVTTLMRK